MITRWRIRLNNNPKCIDGGFHDVVILILLPIEPDVKTFFSKIRIMPLADRRMEVNVETT